jgi:hypothetical protein
MALVNESQCMVVELIHRRIYTLRLISPSEFALVKTLGFLNYCFVTVPLKFSKQPCMSVDFGYFFAQRFFQAIRAYCERERRT